MEFDFDKMFQKVVDVINFRVDEKHQKFTVRIDSNIPRTLVGDDQRLAQVISNLLTNAVKFTPDGGAIHLDAQLASEKNNVCTLLITIKDTGIGISSEQRMRLFNAFTQAEASTTRKYGGTGLGLVISKNIVEMMDGAIWVDSEAGEGAAFSFTVNLVRGKGEHKKLLCADAYMEDIRILAIDDDPDILAFFNETAKILGVSCDTASDGVEALALINKYGPYSMYFVDWNMPEMSGIEFANVIHEKWDNRSLIIMISATDWALIQDDARRAGISKFLPKPLFLSAIADCINENYNISRDGDYINKCVIDFKGRCILLAEDVEINREIVIALLEPINLDIDCAVNGAEAVKMYLADPLKYDMIFMDLQMPEMDGYIATQSIRASGAPHARIIPIVAMTANVFKEDVRKCIEAGMNDHIGKPIDFEELVQKIQKYIIL
jgi:CheY-like chemotaxis protein